MRPIPARRHVADERAPGSDSPAQGVAIGDAMKFIPRGIADVMVSGGGRILHHGTRHGRILRNESPEHLERRPRTRQ